MNEANANVISSESRYSNLSSLHNQLDSIDSDTFSFFKVCLFKNIPSECVAVQAFFTSYVFHLIKNGDTLAFRRIYLVLSFYTFKKQFMELIIQDAKNLRNNWLLEHCVPLELYGLDGRASQHYFQSLELKKTLEYISNFGSVDSWIEKEYKKVRIQLFFSILRQNSNIFFFWFVVFLFFIVSLILSAKDNSFTIMEQVKVWLHFIIGKT